MLNIKKILILSLFIIVLLAGSLYLLYTNLLLPVDNNADIHTFQVEQGSSITKIADNLKNEGLIKSVSAFKLYIKLNNYSNFQAGYYDLNTSMSSEEIIIKINSGEAVFPNAIKITFPEGKTILEMANILSQTINYSTEEIIDVWNNDSFIDNAISNFWFVTDDIKKDKIQYRLNGYFFPETYFFDSDNVSPEEVGLKMLEEMNVVLNKYSSDIENHSLSIHQIITFASIVEYEAMKDEDRPIIAGIFYNRLKSNMRLESCATLEMAIGVHKELYTRTDMRIDSPYNTYVISGLPIAPGNCPGEKSIKAVLYPAEHDYYYFLSDIYGDNTTYYSSTLSEHNKLKNKYLK
ncbi:MAG: endolytic transglycosylase MltG [Eubacteriaceae bacterium]